MRFTIPSMLTVLCLMIMAGAAPARTPMVRTEGQRNPGVRGDITVPYLTTGYSAFGAYHVAPRIYSSPNVVDTEDPGATQVYNLPFYGAVQSFGDRSNGAVLRKR
jgi:hypothetical protein